MATVRAFLYLMLALVASSAHAGGVVQLTTPRGATIEVLAEKPRGPGPFPAVILASGAGSDMRQPIQQRTAEALLAQGIAVYRFDWAYRVAGKTYAPKPNDRSAEIEDMQTALSLARRDSDIDQSRIAVAGKSLGSIVAWQLLRTAPELRGAILLTPVCVTPSDDDAAAKNYPDRAREPRPRLWIVGDSDSLCPLPAFYHLASGASQADRVAIVSGDHGYQSPGHPERDERSLALVTLLASDFAAILLASNGQ